jgi:hypothetical protein
MSCARHADAILEHALGEPASAELESHLRICEDCRAALDRERRLVGSIDGELRAAMAVSPDASLAPRIRAAAADRPSARPAWTLFRLMPVAAALAAVITIVLLRQPKPADPAIPLARAAASSASLPSPSVADSPRAVPSSPAVATKRAPGPRVQQSHAASVRLEPEVLVVPGEAELVRRFVATLQTRGIAERSALVARTEAASAELSIPPLEEIPLLDVKPLASADPKETIHD